MMSECVKLTGGGFMQCVCWWGWGPYEGTRSPTFRPCAINVYRRERGQMRVLPRCHVAKDYGPQSVLTARRQQKPPSRAH